MKTIEELLRDLEEVKERKTKAEGDIYELEELIENAGHWVEVKEKIESAFQTVPFSISHYRTRTWVAPPIVTFHGTYPSHITSAYDEEQDGVMIRCIEDQISFSGPLPNLQAFLAKKKMTVKWDYLIEGLKLEREQHAGSVGHIDSILGSL